MHQGRQVAWRSKSSILSEARKMTSHPGFKGTISDVGGPTANNQNVFTLGTPTTEIYVMHGETAAAASFARRLVKEKDAGRPLTPIIDKMNELAQQYHDNSRPIYCARRGFVDEVVSLSAMRKYIAAFAGCAYQNPASICPHHHMMLPRIIRG